MARQGYGTRIEIDHPGEILVDRPSGVCPVWCEAAADMAEAHATQSYTVNFIVCRGVRQNSVITFLDVHQVWDNIGVAIRDTIVATGGFIPALVIATGDYNNGCVAGWDEARIWTCIDTMIQRMRLQLAGIGTVWVSGNYDNGYAVGFTNANREAGLGMVEAEFIMLPGDGIVSTRGFASRTTGTLTLSFTYAHAGYLTESIGGSERHTWLTWDEDSVARSVKRDGGQRPGRGRRSRPCARTHRGHSPKEPAVAARCGLIPA